MKRIFNFEPYVLVAIIFLIGFISVNILLTNTHWAVSFVLFGIVGNTFWIVYFFPILFLFLQLAFYRLSFISEELQETEPLETKQKGSNQLPKYQGHLRWQPFDIYSSQADEIIPHAKTSLVSHPKNPLAEWDLIPSKI